MTSSRRYSRTISKGLHRIFEVVDFNNCRLKGMSIIEKSPSVGLEAHDWKFGLKIQEQTIKKPPSSGQ